MADKTCPSCAETIKAAAIRCRFCGEVFASAAAATLPEATTAATLPETTTAATLPEATTAGTPRSTRKLLLVLGIALMIVLGAAAVQEAAKKRPTCDANAAAREHWMETPIFDPRASQNRGAAPQDYGFRALGGCSEKILSRRMSCDEHEVRSSEGDNPWLRDAAGLGFTTYICELPNGEGTRVEFPIESIVAIHPNAASSGDELESQGDDFDVPYAPPTPGTRRLEVSEVRAVVNTQGEKFASCLKHSANFELKMLVDSKGRVTRSKLRATSAVFTRETGLLKCVQRVLGRMKFPPTGAPTLAAFPLAITVP